MFLQLSRQAFKNGASRGHTQITLIDPAGASVLAARLKLAPVPPLRIGLNSTAFTARKTPAQLECINSSVCTQIVQRSVTRKGKGPQ
jgi:hypothetical protein